LKKTGSDKVIKNRANLTKVNKKFMHIFIMGKSIEKTGSDKVIKKRANLTKVKKYILIHQHC